jgi:diadenylate cyclase
MMESRRQVMGEIDFANIFRDFKDIIDVAVVSFVLYKLIIMIRGTRAVQLLQGIIIIIIATALSSQLELRAFNWLLDMTLTTFFFAIPVVFQPELRRALEQLGRGSFFRRSNQDITMMDRTINEIVKASTSLAKNKIGGLVVIEGESGLNDFTEAGTSLGSDISSELLINIFIPNTPLHDGAVIIRKDKILAAACYLPLSENPFISKALGTRHRAGIGISENSDALAVIISEETGQISVAKSGQLYKDLDEKSLRDKLTKHMVVKTIKTSFWPRRSTKNG